MSANEALTFCFVLHVRTVWSSPCPKLSIKESMYILKANKEKTQPVVRQTGQKFRFDFLS